MRKIGLVLVCGILSTSSAFAMGGSHKIPLNLTLNPYVMALQKEFNDASKPVTFDPMNPGVPQDIARGIVLGKQYDCRVFYALAQTNATTPTTAAARYSFTKFGALFLDNNSAVDGGRIRNYADDPNFKHELIGVTDDHLYYESLRVTSTGDLVIEGSTPPQAWAKTILSALGFDSLLPELSSNVAGLAISSVVLGTSGWVVSYTYCPHERMVTPSPSASPEPSASPSTSPSVTPSPAPSASPSPTARMMSLQDYIDQAFQEN